MNEIITIGLDTSKHLFQVHGVDSEGRVVLRRPLRRSEMERFFAKLAPTLIGLEACGAAHHWGRVLTRLGHEVRLMPPQYVKPYVKRNKSDGHDAAAACEAVRRPDMRFVAIKSEDQQAALMLLRTRALLIRQRTMLINAIRGHAAEFGVIGAKGRERVQELVARIRAEQLVPAPAQAMLDLLAEQLAALEAQCRALDARVLAWHRADAASQRLATIPGVGPITAVHVRLTVPDAARFRSGRHFAAWLGLTPKEHSTGGRQRLGKISRAGDETLRRLLVAGATAVVKTARADRSSPWLMQLLARRPRKPAAVALANKTARIVWALIIRGDTYRRPSAA